jgi:hypothetical protein
MVFLFLSILIVSCTSGQQQFVRESKKNFDKRLIYLIDGKLASKSEAIRQNDAGIANLIEAASDSRSALLQYGEKYRYGILILVTNDKEKK